MTPRFLSLAFAAVVTFSAVAQSAEMTVPISSADPSTPISANEFGRADGGEIRAVTKSMSSGFSGTLGFFGSSGGNRRGYEASGGGTLIEDKAWFFASGQSISSRFNGAQIGGLNANQINALDAKAIAQIGDRNSLNATYIKSDNAAFTPASITLPSSFLSLHYTGVVSSNMFFTANVSRSKSRTATTGSDLLQ